MRLLIWGFALLYTLEAIAQAPTNGLVAYYPLDGNATDASGKNNNGTIYGTVISVTGQSGTQNGALQFTDSSKIWVTNSSSLTFTDAFSYSTWVKLRSFAGRDGYTGLSKITNYGFHTIFSKYCDRDWFSSMFSADSTAPGIIDFAGGTWYGGYLSTFFEYSLDTWMHLATVYNGRELENYVNGKLVSASLAKIDFTASNSSDLIIGGMACWPYFFNGDMDEMRFYNRALTRNEIQAMYIYEKAPIQSVKIGNWQDPTTWSCNCLPTSWDKVQVRHVVTVPAGIIAKARKIMYETGGKVKVERTARLLLAK